MGQECCKLDDGIDDPENPKNVVRFFMVGTGGAGKTTVVRQLKCLCKESSKDYKAFDSNWGLIDSENIFSRLELNQFKRRIKFNILTAIYNLIEQTHEWRQPISVPESVSRIKDAKEDLDVEIQRGATDISVDDTLAMDIIRILDDEAIKKSLGRSHQMSSDYRLEDGTLHFLTDDNISRIFDKKEELTCEDIVHSRYPTTDIQDFRFGIKKMKMQIHDMGGQASELGREPPQNKKIFGAALKMKCISDRATEDVFQKKLPEFIQQWVRTTSDGSENFLLFVTSMADFNLIDENNSNFTAMDRSVRVLDIVLGMQAVHECGVMIFFNKQDRFDFVCQELLKTEEGRKEILKYLGADMDNGKKDRVMKGTIEEKHLHGAVAKKFMKVIKPKRKIDGSKGVYYRFTQATDQKVMKLIFDAIDMESINNVFNNIDKL